MTDTLPLFPAPQVPNTSQRIKSHRCDLFFSRLSTTVSIDAVVRRVSESKCSESLAVAAAHVDPFRGETLRPATTLVTKCSLVLVPP